LFHAKAKLMVEGHKKTWEMLEVASSASATTRSLAHSAHSAHSAHLVVWFHVASLGEFEQGRPLIEKYKAQYPDHFIVLTFFSPSGYEIRKNYDKADLILYLPLDSKKNAERFLNLVQPNLAIFVKYEYWYFYLTGLKKRNIPTLLVSAIFRENSVFFGPFGSFFRQILNNFTRLYLQNQSSANLLKAHGVTHLEVVGDTRFDRVFELSQQIEPWEIKNQFVGKEEFAVAGSVWEADMQVLIPLMQQSHFKWIVAPHEMHEAEMKHWAEELNLPVAYSKGSTLEEIQEAKILFVNEFGRLSALYKSCKYAYIGGSFGAGLHNTLEAAVFGPPIFFGNKNYQKFQEAVDLIEKGIAFVISSTEEMEILVSDFEKNADKRLAIEKASTQFVKENVGATKKIMTFINQLEGWKKA